MLAREEFGRAEIDAWVDEDAALVDRSIFIDPDIYRLEQQRIFQTCWLYLGHESEIPNPGDYVTRNMSEDPVILVRGQDGKIRAFLNSCSHRGTLVCRANHGNTRVFKCPYHAWIYDNQGALVALAHTTEFYEDELKLSELGLKQVAQLDTYAGLIFATWSPDAPPLGEYLGDLRFYLDLFFQRTPGGMEVLGPPHRWVMQANWKIGAVNFGADGPHAVVVHGPVTDATLGKGGADLFTDVLLKCPAISTGTGHNGIYIPSPEGMPPFASYPQELIPSYREALNDVQFGLLSNMLSGVQTTFPNFSWVQAPVSFSPDEPPVSFLAARVWNPLGPERTEIWDWFFVEKEAPEEWKRMSMRNAVRTFSAAGTFDQDDAEAWAGINLAFRGDVARQEKVNFQAVRAFRDKRIDDFPGPGRIYPSAYGEVTEFEVLLTWKRLMMAQG